MGGNSAREQIPPKKRQRPAIWILKVLQSLKTLLQALKRKWHTMKKRNLLVAYSNLTHIQSEEKKGGGLDDVEDHQNSRGAGQKLQEKHYLNSNGNSIFHQ